MAIRKQTISVKDLGAGIDQQSAESSIPEGFVENALNADPQSQGSIKTRAGYEGYGGYLPVRVKKVEYKQSEQQMCFTFDSSINLSNIRSTPVFLYGRTSATPPSSPNGDFNQTDSYHWYPSFETDTRQVFSTGVNNLTRTGFLQPIVWGGVARSTSFLNNSNEVIYPNSISTSQTTFDLNVSLTNGLAPFTGFIYFLERPSLVGTTYNSTPTTIPANTTQTISIPQSTHQLNNLNILAKAFQDDGTDLIEVYLDDVTIAPNGDVTAQLTNGQSTSIDIFLSLTIAPVQNTITGTVGPNSTLSLPIPNQSTGNFPFINCFLEESIGGNRSMVVPDSIVTDASTNVTTVTFKNSSSTAASFFINYIFVEVPTNTLCVTPETPISADFIDERPQLTLWGIPHASIYSSSDKRQGWTNFIDSYQSVGQDKMVAGLGGNLFLINNQGLPTLYPNLRNRIATSSIIGPSFYGAFDSPTRTRGYIQGSDIEENAAKVNSITYDSNTGWMLVSLAVQNLSITGTLSTILSVNDVLNISGASFKIQNGSFSIKQVANPDASTIQIWVDNPNLDSTDWDDSNSGALATSFSDSINLVDFSEFIVGDQLLSDAFSSSYLISVIGSSGSTIRVNGVVDQLQAPAGLRVVGSRKSAVLPVRDLDENETISNLVRGDLLSFTGIPRKIRILSINPNGDTSISVTGNGVTATLTLGSGDTTSYSVGQQLVLVQSGVFTGSITVSNITSNTQLEFNSSIVGTATGTLKGYTIELDEQLAWTDNQNSLESFSVAERWNPIEAPDDSFTQTPSTYVTHFAANTYDNQPYFQSVMSSDNLYVNSGDDSPFKMDGSSLYRAGLIRWQPHLYVSKDVSPATGGTIDVQNITVNVSSTIVDDASNGIGFKVDLALLGTFTVGKKIEWSVDSQLYTIDRIEQDVTNNLLLIYVTTNLSTTSGTGTISRVYTYKYYFRLNAVDTNNNVIASATVGSEDFVVEFGRDTQVRIRLVGMPIWDIYDYDRLEVQIYRTKSDGALFYRLATLPMNFNLGAAYIDYADTDADDVLFDVDEVSTIFNGVELGNQWSPPLRSTFNTSIQNRLVQASITEDPKLDIQLVDTGSRINVAKLTGQRYLFKKFNTDPLTTSDLESRVAYEFLSSGDELTIDPTTDVTGVPGTSVTIQVVNTAQVGDFIYLFKDTVVDGAETRLMGHYQLSAVTGTSVTFLASNAIATYSSDDVDRLLFATQSGDVPVWLGTDGNYGMLNGNRVVTGPYEFVAMRRLANAINTSMRYAMEPWIVGNAGNEFQAGQLVVTQPKVFSAELGITPIFELTLPSFTGYTTFVNGVKRSSGNQISSLEIVRPSRVIWSYPNYPELMNNPTALIDTESLNVADINTSDGQAITGIIPFFGDSAFGAALKDSIVVVFKQNSIYLLNIGEKEAGRTAVQKVESNGQGCTAPRSIAATREGIMFANRSGLYRLTRDLRVEYVGQRLQRLWEQTVNKDELDLATATNFRIQNKYKLSYPLVGDKKNSQVFVYDHTREYNREFNSPYAKTAVGSWTVYDAHSATGWANLLNDSFFSTTDGQVMRVRNVGDETDYRDDAQPINLDIIFAANDFTDGGIRKIMDRVLIDFRAIADTTGTKVYAASNLSESFDQLDPFQLDVLEPGEMTNLSDESNQKVLSIRFVTNRRKCLYLQLRVTNGNVDEPVEIAGIEYRVAGYSDKGTTEARSTK